MHAAWPLHFHLPFNLISSPFMELLRVFPKKNNQYLYPLAFSYNSEYTYLESFKKKNIYFNWKLIILQYWDGFCLTSTWISHRSTCVWQQMACERWTGGRDCGQVTCADRALTHSPKPRPRKATPPLTCPPQTAWKASLLSDRLDL